MSEGGKCWGEKENHIPPKNAQLNLKFWHDSGGFLFCTHQILMDIVKNQSLPSV